jgi:hypothetical protein
MTGNANFANPPVDLTVFKTAIDLFNTLIAEALDGSKKVKAQKNKQNGKSLSPCGCSGVYVEVTSNGDPSIFQTSGFQAASTTKTTTQPLSETIRKDRSQQRTDGRLGKVEALTACPTGDSFIETQAAPSDVCLESDLQVADSSMRTARKCGRRSLDIMQAHHISGIMLIDNPIINQHDRSRRLQFHIQICFSQSFASRYCRNCFSSILNSRV